MTQPLKHRRVLSRKSLVLWYKFFSTKTSENLFLCTRISDFWKTEVFPNEIFWHCQKTTCQYNWGAPLLCMNFFDTRVFRKRMVPPRFFLVLTDKWIWKENSDIHFLFTKIFEIPNFLKRQIVLQRVFLAIWDKKNFPSCLNFNHFNFFEFQKPQSLVLKSFFS